MSAAKDYIPRPNEDFKLFEGYVVTVITPNAAAWNIPAVQSALLTTWSLGYLPLYNAIAIKSIRTQQQVTAHDVYRKDYESFLRKFLQGFVVNNILIPVDERTAMGLNPRGLNPRSARPKITTPPIPYLQPKGGGSMRFRFQMEETGGRPKRHPDSDGVDVYYCILDQDAPPPAAPVVVESQPAPPANGNTAAAPTLMSAKGSIRVNAVNTDQTEDGYEIYFSTRAQFTKQLNIADRGKVLHIYARWVNNVKPENSGPFSSVVKSIIS
jgi:hypothetical protein